MTTFVASKFDPENDPERPQIGEVILPYGRSIQHVSWMLVSDVLKGEEPEERDGCEMLMKEHSTRPVVWVIWIKST